jgi:hypothetical protein
MNRRIFNAISGRLSLRPPQAESLERLIRAIAAGRTCSPTSGTSVPCWLP